MKPTVSTGQCALLLVVTLFAAAALANQSTNPPKWWNSSVYKKELALKDEQSRKLEEIFQQALPTQKKLLQAVEEAEAQFERLVTSQAEEKAILEQIDRVVSARAELIRSYSLMTLKMRRLMTPEQWKRLQVVKEQERRKGVEKPR